MTLEEAKAAILRELDSKGAGEQPIDMTIIGPALIAAGYEVDHVVFAIDILLRERRVERSGSNALRVICPKIFARPLEPTEWTL